MQKRLLQSALIATTIAAAFAVGFAWRSRALAAGPAVAPTPAPAIAISSPASLPDFAGIVERYGPAVVNVSTTGTVKTHLMPQFGPMDPHGPFSEFFRRFHGPEQQGERLTHGLGSGFLIKSDGVVLTNAHVVNGANEVKVKLTDKREYTAKVVGLDKTTDVAVLKIDAKDLPTVEIGDPARTRVGEWVLAIGSPFGFENSATAGIVSARSRSLPDEGYVPFLQTDVAVNPGNSGGPLFNAAGQVIGINSQIYSRSGGYQGLSFAIPIDVAMKVQGQLLARGKVVRGRMGVAIQDVNQALADSFGLPKPQGALVSSVEPESPAAKAGLKPGDVILSLDGTDVASSSELPPRVADLAPGTNTKLGVWRDHKTREIVVKVGESNDGATASATDGSGERGRLGLAVRLLSPEERQQTGAAGGLVVEQVEGPAARAGVQVGDVVLAVNGTSVTTVDQLRGLVARSGKSLALLVQREGATMFVPVDLG